MQRRGYTIAVLATALTACTRAPVDSTRHQVDSAGVAIVTSDAPTWTDGAPWHIDTVPVVDIGGENDSLAIDSAPFVLLLPGSALLVEGDGDQGFKLLYLDSAGTLLRSVGRSGQGPGEFERVGRMVRAGDSIVVWDPDLRRLTHLSPRGDLGRIVSPVFSNGAIHSPAFVGRWRDGRWMFVEGESVNSSERPGVRRTMVPVVRLDAAATHDTLLGEWPGSETMVVTSTRIVSDLDVPYLRRTTIRWSEEGFWVGTADESRIDAYDQNGRLVKSVRWRAVAITVGSDELPAWRKQRLIPISPEIPAFFAEPFNAAIREARFPETRPPYNGFLVADDGALWVSRVPKWDAGDAPREWDVFTPDGDWLGALMLPSRFSPSEIRNGRLVGQWKDADDVNHVRVYRILK